MNIPKSGLPRVVIIGGGFGGVALARKLRKKEVQVVLIDKHNYHTFQPLLYQVSTGGLEPDSLAYPLRKILKDSPNSYFRLAEVLEIKADENLVMTDIGSINYDYLVLAKFFRKCQYSEQRNGDEDHSTMFESEEFDLREF